MPLASEKQLETIENVVTSLGAPITAAFAIHDSHGENGTAFMLHITVSRDSVSPKLILYSVITAADATTFPFSQGFLIFTDPSGTHFEIHDVAAQAGFSDRYLKPNDLSITRFDAEELHALADSLR